MNGLFHMVKQWVKIKRMTIFGEKYTLFDEIVSEHKILALLALMLVALDNICSSQHVLM